MKNQGAGLIVGLLLGASFAIHTALKVPELVKGMVLTGYSPFIPDMLQIILRKLTEFKLDMLTNKPLDVKLS